MRYPHWIRVTTPTEPTPVVGGTDDGGGFGTPTEGPAPDERTVLDCACDVQDVGQVVPARALGLPNLDADTTVFVADERALFDVPNGSNATVTLDPESDTPVQVMQGEVTYVRALDGALLVRFPAAA
jgi:hypothetical protein